MRERAIKKAREQFCLRKWYVFENLFRDLSFTTEILHVATMVVSHHERM